MSTMPTIEVAKLEDVYLDFENPRLGRQNVQKGLNQDEVLDLMRDWSLEELAYSFLESGFWPQEPLIALRRHLKDKQILVVVEGNRRLAALKMIDRAKKGEEQSSKWQDVIRGYPKAAFERLKDIPYVVTPKRESVLPYLGFRHVTGVKEWNPAEKAQFIAHLIEDENLDYEQAGRRIGSKTSSVRQNYISYRVLQQMENQADEVNVQKVKERFSLLFISLRTKGVQQYLDVEIESDPKAARMPVPKGRLGRLVNFARWLFGTEKQEPVVEDSRQVDDFGRILESEAAVDYLERNERPSFAVARRMAGVAESEVADHVERAADEVEEALKAAHQHKASKRLQSAVRRLGADTLQLLDVFPSIKGDVLGEDE